MKRKLLIAFIIVQPAILRAQNVGLAWVKQMAGTDAESYGYSIKTDAAGNIYTTGYFRGNVDFDPGPGVFNLSTGFDNSSTTAYAGHVFVSKLNAEGNLVWAKEMEGGSYAYGYSIAVDPAGNVYTAGVFQSTVDFDPGPGIFNLTVTDGHNDIFISKLDADGNFVWARQIKEPIGTYAFVSSIAVDAAGSVYTSGYFYNSIDFDPGDNSFSLNSLGGSDIFISKLDADGNFAWAKQLGGTGADGRASIVTDITGNVYASGIFQNTVDFDPGVGVFNLSSAGVNNDIFICKLDSAGNFIWAKQMGGTDANANDVSIALDSFGNIYTGGSFQGTVDFDPGVRVFNLTSSGPFDIFVSKLDGAGNFIWTKQIGGAGTDVVGAIAVDVNGNPYVTGTFEGTVDFDSTTCVPTPPSATVRFFLTKLDAAGNFAWAKDMGVRVNSMAIDASGSVCSTGGFSDTVDFDPGIGKYELSALGAFDFFVHKMSPCSSSSSSTISVTACNSYTLNCKTYTSSGVYKQTFSNLAGCDSLITLNLTIVNANKAVTVYNTACDSYFWKGQTQNVGGTYIDTLRTATGCDSIVTLHLTINPKSFININQTICSGQSFLGYTQTGTYIDTMVAANGCDSIRTLQLLVQQKPAPDLGVEKNICSGDLLVLYPGQFSTYMWQDGSAQDSITVRQPGLYSVMVTNACGTATDEIIIKDGICDIHFPTAFTPNNDGKNDLFKALGARNLNDFHFIVCNRWGQVVFETTDYSRGWSGTLKGKFQPAGTYAWYCTFKKSNNPQNVIMKGTVVLIR